MPKPKLKTFRVFLKSGKHFDVRAQSAYQCEGTAETFASKHYFFYDAQSDFSVRPCDVSAIVEVLRVSTARTAYLQSALRRARSAKYSFVVDPKTFFDFEAIEAHWAATGEFPEDLGRSVFQALRILAGVITGTKGKVKTNVFVETIFRELLCDPAKGPTGVDIDAEYEDA